MCKKMSFSYTNCQKNLLHTLPSSVASLPQPSLWRFGPMLANLGCTTVTCIAKGRRAHVPPPPIDWNKRVEYGIGLCHFTYPIPLIMTFRMQENADFIHKFASPSVNPPPTLPPPPGRFAPSLCPPPLQIVATPLSLA